MLYKTRDLQQSDDLSAMIRYAESDPTNSTSVAQSIDAGRIGTRTGWGIGHLAQALRLYNDEDRRNIIGSDLRNGVDRECASWFYLGYERAEAAGEPVVEDVRALVLRRNAAPLESTYRRVLIPFKGMGGKLFIFCAVDVKQQQAA